MTYSADPDLSQRLPTRQEAEQALDALRTLERLAGRNGGLELNLRGEADSEAVVELSPSVSRMVLDLLTHIGRGEMVTFIPSGAELTTQQAADILNVSRPYLVKLLDSGEIPHHRVGRHRRVKASDVLSYKRTRDAERTTALDELARLGQAIDD